MKITLFLVAMTLTSLTFAKASSFSGFTEALNERIDSVVENNPEKYEEFNTHEIKRGPASVEPDPLEKTEKINNFDKLEVGSSKL